jgi:hypothetical protein
MLHAIVVRRLGRRLRSCLRMSGVLRRHGSGIGSGHGGTVLIPGRIGWPVNDPARLSPFFPIGAAGAAGPERRQASASVRLLFLSARRLAAPSRRWRVKGMTTASFGGA